MPANILPDLWNRLAQLDGCCTVQVSNARAGGAGGEGLGPLVWFVLVTRRDDPSQVRGVEATSLPEALTAAVFAAIDAGWLSESGPAAGWDVGFRSLGDAAAGNDDGHPRRFAADGTDMH